MAVDNLNYYSSGLPAGQLTDRYSSQPGCLKSKNLDIFSSSKSVKATAWSDPSAGASDIIKQDGDLILKTDGKVYDISSGSEVLVVDPSINFPVYKVSYNGKSGTYANTQWGTVKDMVVAYEGDEWKSFVVFTDRSSYTYSKVPYIEEKTLVPDGLTYDTYSPYSGEGYVYTKTDTSSSSATLSIDMPGHFANVPIRIRADQYNSSNTDITIDSIMWFKQKFYYDPEIEQIMPNNVLDGLGYLPVPAGDIKSEWVEISIPEMPSYYGSQIEIKFKFTKKDGASNFGWNGRLGIDVNLPETPTWRVTGHADGDYNEYYSYLPISDNRQFINIGEYYWQPAQSYQTLYKWESSWAEVANREKKTRYDFVQYMGWANDPAMDVVAMISWNEQVYMIGNMNGNGYIIPCDLSGGMGTPFIAYGCTFRGATNIDYLLYLVGEDRGISQLWVYNGQELVPLLGGNLESGVVDYVNSDEQYNFDGKMVEYRGNLVLATTDGRIFEYGQTYGGKGGAFIHDLGANLHDSLTIDSLKAKGNDLKVDFSVTDTIEGTPTTTKWSTTYQDDVPIKHYNSAWEAVYPIVLGNHLLEKEESDLYASYILPDGDTHLEFWGCANHYHFWTFKTSQYLLVEDPAWTHRFGIKGTQGDYYLEFVERVQSPDGLDWYTFRLVGSLPLMAAGATNTVVYLDDDGETVVDFIKFSEVNHFRKIGDVYPDTFTFEDEEYGKYTEGEFRFHNLNNKLELPKSHSLQVKVIGYGTNSHTPELFALDLVANQRDRG